MTTNDGPGLVTRALRVAEHHHAGQEDKLMVPYICHPMTVALWMDTEDEMALALLHDTLEDTDYPEDQARADFPDLIDDLLALTHRPGEPRWKYYDRINVAGRRAKKVKRADIRHNTDPARMAKLPDTLRDRLTAKYEDAALALGTTLIAIHEEFPPIAAPRSRECHEKN